MQPTHERLYPPHKIAAVVKLLFDDGVAMEDALQGTGLDVAALWGHACQTSIAQYQRVCSNALALTQNRSISFRAGESLHLSDHGMYGLLLMSCESMRHYFNLAVKYQLLAAPCATFDWGDGETLCITLDPAELTLPPELAVFVAEQQFMQLVTHLGDALGTVVRPTLACFAYPAPPHWDLYGHYFQCPCIFDCKRSELQFPPNMLASRPHLANPLAAATLQSSCDGLMGGIESALGFAGRVCRTLRQLSDPGASMVTVAAAMQMTDRTLRRRLADEGTSFSRIAHQLKYRVAAQHLRNSDASMEQIASIAGFSDPANFRRAFIRWTNMTPAQFRRQNTS